METRDRQFPRERRSGTIALLVFSLVGSALLIGLAAKTERYPYVACVGLVPLFVVIRVCRPLGALLWGAVWGLSFLAVSVAGLGPPIPPTVGSLLLLAGAPAVYAWLGSLLTRWIGFSPYVLAVGWMALELTLSLFGLPLGLAGATQAYEWSLAHWFARALGYVFVAFLVAYVNAALVSVLSRVWLTLPRPHHAAAIDPCEPSPYPQWVSSVFLFAIAPSGPRAPPLAR